MKYYSSSDAPKDTVIWGCAYTPNNYVSYNSWNKEAKKTMALVKKPVKGMIKGRYFYELKKNGEIKKNPEVYATSRVYADTFKESYEMFKELVKKQIKHLEGLIEICKEDLI